MKISGSQVSAKLVMRLQRLGPGVFATTVETLGLVGCRLSPVGWVVLFATGTIPPLAGALVAQVLVSGGHFCSGVAARAAVAGASSASESRRAAAARGRILPGGCETTAVIQCSHRP